MISLQVFRALDLRRGFPDERRLMTTNHRASRLSPMMAEPEDARLTGQTRNLERRLLVLNVTRQGNAIGAPSSWLARTSRSFTRLNKNKRLCCPSFEFDLRVADNSTQIAPQITGPEGVKQFMKAALSEVIG